MAMTPWIIIAQLSSHARMVRSWFPKPPFLGCELNWEDLCPTD